MIIITDALLADDAKKSSFLSNFDVIIDGRDTDTSSALIAKYKHDPRAIVVGLSTEQVECSFAKTTTALRFASPSFHPNWLSVNAKTSFVDLINNRNETVLISDRETVSDGQFEFHFVRTENIEKWAFFVPFGVFSEEISAAATLDENVVAFANRASVASVSTATSSRAPFAVFSKYGTVIPVQSVSLTDLDRFKEFISHVPLGSTWTTPFSTEIVELLSIESAHVSQKTGKFISPCFPIDKPPKILTKTKPTENFYVKTILFADNNIIPFRNGDFASYNNCTFPQSFCNGLFNYTPVKTGIPILRKTVFP